MRHALLLACLLAACGTATAQLRLPGLPGPNLLPGQPGLGPLDTLRRPVDRLVERVDLPDLRALRLDQATALLRRHPDVLEADPRGAPAVRGEILAWNPAPAALDAARAAGLAPVRDTAADGAGDIGRIVVLRVPAGAATDALLERLRTLDPDGHYDFNHLYFGSGGGTAGEHPSAPASAAAAPAAGAGALRVGLVDSGVAPDHRALRAAAVRPWGCAGRVLPDAHGTAVAALLVGDDERFRGAAPGATLYAADIYCGADATGGSAERIAGALGWLARERVGVINLSLVGPPNAVLERIVAALVARGHLLVAAVGNDGPAAPPLYPASYPGVVGVTGVDRDGRPLPEAARGPQVRFAAPGKDMVSAAPGQPPYRSVRGTSYAAPLVAGLLAPALPAPAPAAARAAVDALARTAAGAGTRPDDVLGHGIVGARLRVDAARLR